MDWTRITDNAEVIKLLKQRADIENKIKAIDKNALIMHELELLSIPAVVGQSEQLPILDRCGCEEPNEEPIKVCINCNGYVE